MGLISAMDFWPVERSLARVPGKGFWARIKSIFDDTSSLRAATVVCVPSGAQLILKDVPEDLQRRWNIEEKESVFFLQINANVNSYRDAVHFRNGIEVLLQSLREGIRVHVLSLGNAPVDSERNLAVPVG
jgi:hypothetical protein